MTKLERKLWYVWMNLPRRPPVLSSAVASGSGLSGMGAGVYPICGPVPAIRSTGTNKPACQLGMPNRTRQLASKRTSAPPLRLMLRLVGFPFTSTFAPPERSASSDSEAATSAWAPPLPLIDTEVAGTSIALMPAPPDMCTFNSLAPPDRVTRPPPLADTLICSAFALLTVSTAPPLPSASKVEPVVPSTVTALPPLAATALSSGVVTFTRIGSEVLMCPWERPILSRPLFTSVRTSGTRLSSADTVTDVFEPTEMFALTPCSTLTEEKSPTFRLSSLTLPLPSTAKAIAANFASTTDCMLVPSGECACAYVNHPAQLLRRYWPFSAFCEPWRPATAPAEPWPSRRLPRQSPAGRPKRA